MLLIINQPSLAQPEADEPRKHLGQRAASDDLTLALQGWKLGLWGLCCSLKMSHSQAGYPA